MGDKKRRQKAGTENPKEQEPKLEFSANEVDRIMGRITSKHGEDRKELRRRGCSIVIYPEQCLPGSLTVPIKISIQELTSDEEIRAYRAAGGISVAVGDEAEGLQDPETAAEEASVSQQALSVAFGKESFFAVNGKRLTSDEKRSFWEIFGMTGRLAIGMSYMAHCTGASGGFLNLSLASAEVW